MELRTLGFNAQTVGFLGTLLFTTLSAQARWLQYRTIVAKRSGESVATSFHLLNVPLFAIVLVYGIATERLALIYNGGATLVACLAIASGLVRFKRLTLADWATLAIGGATLTVMLMAESSTARGVIFGSMLFAGVVWGLMVPRELWKTKRTGAFRIEGSVVAAVSTSFWVVYGFSTKDRTLMVVCPAQLAGILLTITLWLRYGGDPQTLFRKQAV